MVNSMTQYLPSLLSNLALSDDQNLVCSDDGRQPSAKNHTLNN